MSDPVVYHPTRRLVSLMRKPGGVTIEEGIAQAKERLAEVRGECTSALDALIDGLTVEGASRDEFRRIYLQCSEIFGLAGAFGLDEEKAAAKALCSLLEVFGSDGSGGPADGQDLAGLRAPVEVIINGLKVLRRTETVASLSDRAEMVRGLQQVADKWLRSAAAVR